jgi:hypothetical protein
MKKEDENIRTGGGGVDEEAVAADDVDINSPPELLQQDQDDDGDVTLPSLSLPSVISPPSVTNTIQVYQPLPRATWINW